MQEPTRIELGKDDDGRRADRVVRKALKSVPLSTIYRLFRQKRVKIGERIVGVEERVKEGDVLELLLPGNLDTGAALNRSEWQPPFNESALDRLSDQPRVVWENKQLAAFHKPRGMLTHDGSESLEAFARHALRDRLPPSASFAPGPLHRLDRNTSGIVVFSKSRSGAEAFSKELAKRHIRKFYVAIVQGKIEGSATFEDRFSRDRDRRRTIADEHGAYGGLWLTPLAEKDGATLVLVELYTGLTHQIRAQLSAHGHPLQGDVKYGNYERMNPDGYFLHAHTLALPLSLAQEMPNIVSDPLPSDFIACAMNILGPTAFERSPSSETMAAPLSGNLDEHIVKIIEDMV